MLHQFSKDVEKTQSCVALDTEHLYSQAEKERTACKAEKIHKMTTNFTQNDNLGSFIYHFVNLFSFASGPFFLSMEKNHVTQLATIAN